MSLPTCPLVTFIDVEASGLQQPDSYPIEIGWADTLGNTDSFLIRPESDWAHWDEAAEAVHGIMSRQLLSKGISVREAAERLNQSLGLETAYCDAEDFDGFWLRRLFAAAGTEASFKLADVRSLYGGLSQEQIANFNQLLRQSPSSHRAAEDAQRLASAFSSSASETLNEPKYEKKPVGS